MNVLSLFTGIGGLDLGLEWAGMTIVGQVEIDPWCRKILAKHWPEVPRHDDVRTCADWWLGALADTQDNGPGWRQQQPESSEAARQMAHGHAARTAATGGRPAVDLVCGGFPCQPVSTAGRRLAQDDPRWLWPAMAEVIRRLRPAYALMENVPGLLARGFGDVLGDLAACGYDTEWDCVPAAAVGAPHRRDRVWIVAYPRQLRRWEGPRIFSGMGPEECGQDVADTQNANGWRPDDSSHPRRRDQEAGGRDFRRTWVQHWRSEPRMGRVAHGVPARVDRLRGLGNAVVPQVAEHIGRLIMEAAA